jgi:hypothetical protein
MMRSIRVTLLVVGLPVLAVLALVLFWPRAPLDSALTSPTAPPTRLVCYGYVDSRLGPLLLQPARPGRVIRVFVQEQEAALAVQAAQLQLTKAQDGVKQYQARRAQAEAALEAANSKVLAAQHALARQEDWLKKDLLSQTQTDIGRAELNEARALAKAAENRLVELKAVDPELEVKLTQLQLNRSQTLLEQAHEERKEHLLQAPVSGLVLRVQAQEGDLVGPTSPRPAVWLAPGDGWIIRAEVAQEFAGRVQEGQDVQVEDEASTSLLAKGRIAAVSDWFLPRRQFSALPTSVNTGLTLECAIDLQEGHGQLRLGQRVRVRILADQPARQRGRAASVGSGQ